MDKELLLFNVEKDNVSIKKILNKINDTKTYLCAFGGEKMLETIGGDCDTAIGGLAEINNNN